jgi:signal transduction histidine kinase
MTNPTPDHKKIVVQQNAEAEPFEVYHLSHDLRGPLNSILGFTELLLEEIEGPLTDVQKEDISAINQSAHNLLRLINNMVDVSKLDADHLDLNESEVDLNLVINNVLTSDFWMGQAAKINVAVNLKDNLPLAWGDGPRIAQMFEELLAWSKLKGTQNIKISTNNDNAEATVQIHLAGVMVSGQDMEDIFKLITRKDGAGRNHLGPGGLEIPLVRRLAKKQQARVWAEAVGSGTSFYLTFPIAETQG